jgi:hypothetical protein
MPQRKLKREKRLSLKLKHLKLYGHELYRVLGNLVDLASAKSLCRVDS